MNNGKQFEIVKEEEVTYIKATINDTQGNRVITMQKVDEGKVTQELEALRDKVRHRTIEISNAIQNMKEQLTQALKDLEESESDVSSLNELLNNK